jgi:hypothetical protein
MNPVALFLSRLRGVKPTGKNKWKAHCPAHDDASPSLTVGVGDKSQVLFHCFANCSADEILGAVSLNFPDLYPPDTKFASSGRGLQTNRHPQPRWARPGNEERLRRACACLFLLCAEAFPPGTEERELAAVAMGEASEVLGGLI